MEVDKDNVDELKMLKARATLMGIVFSNNISVETLRQKIEAKISEVDTPVDAAVNPLEVPEVPVSKSTPSLRDYLISTEMKLVRLRITNLDPKKKDLPGDIIAVANEFMGTVRKYIPFGEVTENGYHVPYCLYKELEGRKFLNVRTLKEGRSGQIRVETTWAREFALDVLPPLTSDELMRLAMTQSASGSVSD